jgi:hypothetical protein
MKIKTILACRVAVMTLPGTAVAAEDRSVNAPAELAAVTTTVEPALL